MSDPLRDRRPLRELAGNGQVVEISAKIGDFERLSGAIDTDLGKLGGAEVAGSWRETPVIGRLRFGLTGQDSREPQLDVDVRTTVAAVCQRCLHAFELPLEVELKLRLAGPGDVAGEHEGLELWELDDDVASPLDIVDEALTMALPMSAKHDDPEQCAAIGSRAPEERMTTPFATLRAQMDEQQD